MIDAASGALGAQGTGPPLTILVADDDAAVRTLFCRVLQDAGYATLEAADGIEALEILAHDEVALVLLDSTMPRLDGTGVIRAIRDRPETRTLPIILVTAKAALEDRVHGLAAGADDYLAKPVALDELEARVRTQLRSHAAWAEAVEREASQRRTMTAALRRVGTEGSAEHVAGALIEELLPVLEVDALAVAVVRPDGTAVTLAASGGWSWSLGVGSVFSPAFARRALEESANGPWLISRRISSDAPTRDAAVYAVFRLEGPDGPFGLLAVRMAPVSDPGAIARRLPLFIELADLTATVLRPIIELDAPRLERRAALEAVIAGGEFHPLFQPVVSLADGAVVGYEALTRFDDGVPPDQRFEEAGRLGLGLELEAATARAAVDASDALPAAASLGLNVSPEFVLSGTLPPILAGANRQIVLEITEHVPIDDYPALLAALAGIEPRVLIAVDDAGSGYASLRHILALQPAYVKLDIGWVRGIEDDAARQSLVAGMVHFARETGCQLVGEGIETEAERRTLLRLGVALGQGYLLGRPARPETRDAAVDAE